MAMYPYGNVCATVEEDAMMKGLSEVPLHGNGKTFDLTAGEPKLETTTVFIAFSLAVDFKGVITIRNCHSKAS